MTYRTLIVKPFDGTHLEVEEWSLDVVHKLQAAGFDLNKTWHAKKNDNGDWVYTQDDNAESIWLEVEE